MKVWINLRRLGASGLVAAALSGAPVARAEPDVDLMQTYEGVCARPASVAEAVTAAHSQGFFKPPPAFVRDLAGSGPDDAQLWKLFEGRTLMLTLRREPFPGYDDLDAITCQLFLSPGDPAAIVELETRLGLGAGEVGEDKTSSLVFAETSEGRKRVDLADEAAMNAAAHDGSLRILAYGPSPGKGPKDSIILQLRPRPR